MKIIRDASSQPNHNIPYSKKCVYSSQAPTRKCFVNCILIFPLAKPALTSLAKERVSSTSVNNETTCTFEQATIMTAPFIHSVTRFWRCWFEEFFRLVGHYCSYLLRLFKTLQQNGWKALYIQTIQSPRCGCTPCPSYFAATGSWSAWRWPSSWPSWTPPSAATEDLSTRR